MIFRGCSVGRMEKAVATHSSTLAWRILGTGEPGGLLSMGLHRVGHDLAVVAVAAVGRKMTDRLCGMSDRER